MSEPPNSDETKAVIKQRIDAVAESGNLAETHRVEWRGGNIDLVVIAMPQTVLRLNPYTQRIKAQLDSDPAKEQLLDDEPYGADAQAYLGELLKGDPSNPTTEDTRYRALVESLSEDDQQDPGIITREGRLIDGNTRCVALRELNVDNMRVAVLPEDAGPEDIELIEIAFSVRREIKREYSFINQILAVESKTESGWLDEKLKREFRIRQPTLDTYRWILRLIRDARNRSKSELAAGIAVGLRWVDFEQHQESLKEIARFWQDRSKTDVDEADAVAEQRLLALIGFQRAKTDLRLIDRPDFFEQFAPDLLPPDVSTASVTIDIPGIDTPVEGSSHAVEALKALTTDVLRSRAVQNSDDRATADELQKAGNYLTSVGDELSAALEKAGKDLTYRRRKLAPADRISDACEQLRLALSAIREAEANNSFVPEELDEPLRDLREALIELGADKLVDAVDFDASDGFDWLRAVTSLGYDS
jgi:hypothetical protein